MIGRSGAVDSVGSKAAGYVSNRGWDTVVHWYVPIGGTAAALAIGAVAGLYPAVRAARLVPTEALASACRTATNPGAEEGGDE